MENEPIELSIDEVINPETIRIIPGKGMPVLNNDPLSPIKHDYPRGNLVVRFDIQFPQDLNEEKKRAITAILDEVAA